MNNQELKTLETLLKKYRDEESIDQSEFDKRESLHFDVEFDCAGRGIPCDFFKQQSKMTRPEKEPKPKKPDLTDGIWFYLCDRETTCDLARDLKHYMVVFGYKPSSGKT